MLRYWRVTFAVGLLLTIAGGIAWQVMPRKEDPSMPDRYGVIRLEYAGAEAEWIERDLVKPIEGELATVQGISHVGARIYAHFALIDIELRDSIGEGDTANVWDEVQQALARAEVDLPARAKKPVLLHHLSYTESVVLAVTGSADMRQLIAAADKLRDALRRRRDVAAVHVAPDSTQYVSIELDEGASQRYGLDRNALVAQLSSRTQGVPGGNLHAGSRSPIIRPSVEYRSLAELASTPVTVNDGALVPLGELARVRAEVDSSEGRARYNGMPAIVVGVEPRPDANAVDFGRGVRATVAQVSREIRPLAIHEFLYQPTYVEERISGLGSNLLSGVALLVVMLVVFMGPRHGLVVGICVPVVTLSTIAVYYFGGGILHQMSVASLVIGLGMLVDNAMVISEEVQRRLDEGETNAAAADAAWRQHALPMGTATATTVAAFIPMLLAESKTADFTRSLPVVLMLSLFMSYLAAVFLVPVVAGWVLRKGGKRRATQIVSALALRMGKFSVRRRWVVLGVTLVLCVGTVMLGTRLETQFFPDAGRSEVLVSLELPDGTDFDTVDSATARVEAALAHHHDVRALTAFVGRTAPKFFYNLPVPVRAPSRAQIVIVTKSPEAVPGVVRFARNFIASSIPNAQGIVRRLEQGPPARAPVSVRIYSESAAKLEKAVQQARRALRQVHGARDVRDDLGVGIPAIRIDVSDADASQSGVSRADVALTLLSATRGIELGDLRTGDESIPIIVRSRDRDDMRAQNLASLNVTSARRGSVALGRVAQNELEWRRSSIARRDGQRLAIVDAELEDGSTAGHVVSGLAPRLAQTQFPAGVTYEIGGTRDGSSDANRALLAMLPVGVFLLILALLIQFNSIRRLIVVIAMVPLGAVGVVPGLVIGNQPFGFMSLLGVVSVAGIVVNNVIMLIDTVQDRQREGVALEDALAESIHIRARPFFLTMSTCMAGLIPLTFSSAPLWPPMAWAMISGLTASAVLSVVIVPALYAVFFRRELRGGT